MAGPAMGVAFFVDDHLIGWRRGDIGDIGDIGDKAFFAPCR